MKGADCFISIAQTQNLVLGRIHCRDSRSCSARHKNRSVGGQEYWLARRAPNRYFGVEVYCKGAARPVGREQAATVRRYLATVPGKVRAWATFYGERRAGEELAGLTAE